MNKFQFPRVETLPFEAFIRTPGTVKPVSKQRMTNGREMDADLMRPAGLKSAAEMRITVVAVQNSPGSLCRTGIFVRNRHFQTVFRIPADRFINRAVIFPEGTAGNRLIFPGQRPVRQLSG